MMMKTRTTISPTTNNVLAEKGRRLHEILAGYESVLIAFSGGVDSAYLAIAAAESLGERALAVTADSPSYPDTHRQLALSIASNFGFAHELINTAELDRPEYRANPANRCYYCKDELYSRLSAIATERGISVVVDGNNADDRGDHRPGRQAAREAGVRSPLDEVGLDKASIRALARRAGLPQWDEPASACLSSRVPYDQAVTPEKLRAIEQAETALRGLGFRGCRVRHHDDVARLELARGDLARAVEPETAKAIAAAVKAAGFRYVALDIEGYRTGSLNDRIPLRVIG